MLRLPSSLSALRPAAILLVLTACGGSAPTSPQAELSAAKMRWGARAPASYSMVIKRSCECLPGTADPAIVTVRDGLVESRRYVASGADVPAEYASAYPTVPEMFAMIEQATRDGVRPIDVEYAPMGYPTRLSIGDPAVDAPVIFISDFHTL